MIVLKFALSARVVNMKREEENQADWQRVKKPEETDKNHKSKEPKTIVFDEVFDKR